MAIKTFGIWDYVVFAVMLVASIITGVYHVFKRKHKLDISEYMLANRSMPCLPVAMSLLATVTSTLLVLGGPAEGYAYGIQLVFVQCGEAIGNVIVIELLMSFTRKLNVTSPFEYIELRFRSRFLRVMITIASAFSILFAMSVVLFGQAAALQAVTGFSIVASILATASVAALYTAIGGLRAVIWTDVLQLFFVIAGLLLLAIKGTIDAGGMEEVWTKAVRTGRMDVSFDLDPTVRHTIWGLVIGRIFNGMGNLFNPAVLQRIKASKSATDAALSLVLMSTGFVLLFCLGLVNGIVAFAYYDKKRCDPIVSKEVRSYNQVSAYMALDLFHDLPGLPGLFLAGLFSASLSTLSSGFSALSTVTWEDFVKPFFPSVSEVKGLLIAKVSVVIYAAICCGVALIVSTLGILTIFQIAWTLGGITLGPKAAVFYLGIFFPFVDTKSATAAFISGVAFMSWIVIGSQVSPNTRKTKPLPPAPVDGCLFNISHASITRPQPSHHYTGSGLDALYSVSYLWYLGIGFCVVIILGVLFSLIKGGKRQPGIDKYTLNIKTMTFFSLGRIGKRRSRTEEGMPMPTRYAEESRA